MKKFVILSSARSGSTYVCRLLNAHPNIKCAEEIFKSDQDFFHGNQAHLPAHLLDLDKRNDDPIRFLHDYWTEFPNYNAVGFKLFFDHEQRITDYVLEDEDVIVIVLKRNNIIRQIVSRAIAKNTNQWLLEPGHQREQSKPHIDTRYLLWAAKHFNKLYNSVEEHLKRSNKPHIILEYEAFFSNQMDTIYREILLLLETPYSEANHPRCLKQNPEPLSELIKNYDEVLSAVEGTNLEQYLND